MKLKKNFSSNNQWSNKKINNIAYSIIPNDVNEYSTIGKYYESGNFIDWITIPVPGLHNLSNITAAIAACRMVGVSFKEIKKLLKPNGILILNVAALPCLRNSHDKNSMGARRFKLAGLRKIAIKNGFKIKQLHYWNIVLTPLIYLKAKIDSKID